MKKAVVLIATAASLASVATGLWVWRRSQEIPPVPAAQLAPAETLFLAELPDLPKSAVRLRETALWKIWHEPDVQAFLARPRSKIPKNGQAEAALSALGEAKAHHAFFALADITKNMPHFVSGFTYGGKRETVEALVAKARAQAQSASPAGKLALVKYGEFEIESFSDKGVSIAGAFAGEWYFVANDLDLLKATIDRSVKKTPGALAESDAYRKSVAHLPADPDLRLFVQPGVFVDKFAAMMSAASQPVEPQTLAELKKMQALAISTKMEGERFHDTCFLLEPGATALPALAQNAMELTTPDTLFYYAFGLALPDKLELPGRDLDAAGALDGARAFLDMLSAQGIAPADVKAAFGPGFALQADWAKDGAQPAFGISAQIRDPALARKLAENVFKGWQREESAGATFWQSRMRDLAFSPAAALTEKRLILGLNLRDLKAFVEKAKANGPTLEKSADFASATAAISKPGVSFAYLDAKAVFQRVYNDSTRTAAMISLSFVPGSSDYVEAGKLPSAESVAKHLSPIALSSSQSENGLLFESAGPFTFYQAGAALGVAAASAAAPILEGKWTIPGFALPAGLGSLVSPKGAAGLSHPSIPQAAWGAKPALAPGVSPAP